ncbi:MAG: hypothetical protein NWF08_02405 [Candidatus Bathyarchaeota archaeon]|nr:hypothetical protein [Candidatus Bathyarchaeota archaeon]
MPIITKVMTAKVDLSTNLKKIVEDYVAVEERAREKSRSYFRLLH